MHSRPSRLQDLCSQTADNELAGLHRHNRRFNLIAVGHVQSDQCFCKSYLSRHLTFNMQVLVMLGKEQRSLIDRNGLYQLPTGLLLASSLSQALQQGINNLLIMLQHCKAAAAIRKALEPATAAGASSDKLALLHCQQVAVLDLINQKSAQPP